MNSLPRLLASFASSLCLSAGLVRAAEAFDPLSLDPALPSVPATDFLAASCCTAACGFTRARS